MRKFGVSGHQRTGTNFLRQACVLNFNLANIDDKYAHKLPRQIGNEGFPRVYIHRDWEDVAKSLWVMRERFGAGAKDFEAFVSTPWSEQWQDFTKSNYVTANLMCIDGKQVDERGDTTLLGTSTFLKNKKWSPTDYYIMHLREWELFKEANPDMALIVSYNDLVSDFQGTMLNIARFVQSPRTSFVAVKGKVGVWADE